MEETKIKNFYDLEVWKRGHNFALTIYTVTKQFPKEELFGIVSQLQRAVSSVTANIAEGFARYHFNDKIKFYYQARGSIAEVQNFILLARDLHYIKETSAQDFIKQAQDIYQLINGLIRSIENQKEKNS